MQTRRPGKNNFFLEYVFLITTYKHTHIDNDTDGRFTGLFLVFCGTGTAQGNGITTPSQDELMQNSR